MMSEVMHDDVQLQPATEGGSQQQDGHDEGISSKDQPSEMGSVVMNASADSLETDPGEDEASIDDQDSALGSFHSSRTQSLTSSIIDYPYENGRRYHAHKSGDYHLPNDESEQDRLDMQHHIFGIALKGELFLAPLPKENLFDVVDVGCGTGIWAMDVADAHPQANVLGFDLSPIQPNMVPPNCSFLVDDLNADWVFPQKFDLVHTRAMSMGIKDFSRYLRQAYDHLKPGGYIELHEVGVPFRCTESTTGSTTPYFVQWSHYMIEAGTKMGYDYTALSKLDVMLQEAGFTNITIQWQNWPLSTWAKGSKNKEVGRLWGEDLCEGVKNMSALFTRVLGWQKDEFDVFAAKIAGEIRGKEKHLYTEMCFAYAQKPDAK